MTTAPPRVLIIGAGSRGNTYSRAINELKLGIIAAVAEPNAIKRHALGRAYIWTEEPKVGQEFDGWQHFVEYTKTRQSMAEGRDNNHGALDVDAVFICVLDEMHKDVIRALAPFGLHIMCEKPLATTLSDCLSIYKCVSQQGSRHQRAVFGIGHVLRYSPVNMLLRQMVKDEEVIGDIVAVEHTEPIGWWHFTHSYVRGNWRNESSTAPSLLTKSCHDIDFLLWLLCSPRKSSGEPPHLPSHLSSFGNLNLFRNSRKPEAAGTATNCMSCPIERNCTFSAKRLYYENNFMRGNTGWPVNIVDPEIEDLLKAKGLEVAETRLLERLRENYDNDTLPTEVRSRSWFGRCVWEADNDVCDDQVVAITWDDDKLYDQHLASHITRHQKKAIFHMTAFTKKVCERRGRIYGTKGEIKYDGQKIEVYTFGTGQTVVYHPSTTGRYDKHGGGDTGLTTKFMSAVDGVKNKSMTVAEAEDKFMGCSLEEILRSHALVFAAEEARKESKVIDWKIWWDNVTALM